MTWNWPWNMSNPPGIAGERVGRVCKTQLNLMLGSKINGWMDKRAHFRGLTIILKTLPHILFHSCGWLASSISKPQNSNAPLCVLNFKKAFIDPHHFSSDSQVINSSSGICLPKEAFIVLPLLWTKGLIYTYIELDKKDETPLKWGVSALLVVPEVPAEAVSLTICKTDLKNKEYCCETSWAPRKPAV